MTDNKLCKALEGTGEVLFTFPVFCITRGGFLLLALPLDSKAARMTLALYHPQSLKARVLVWVVSGLVALKLHRVLPQRMLTIREAGPLASLKNQSNQIGFLLGNAQANARRAIVVHRAKDEGACYVVDKIGFGEVAKKSVIEERLVIRNLPQENTGVPQVCDQGEADGWAYYTTPYFHGRSPRVSDQGGVLSVLMNWSENAEVMPFRSSRQWMMIRSAAEERGMMSMFQQLDSAGDLKIKVGLFHGDFAPWNIKISSEGEINVLDWEHGCTDGPAGWDWLHYMIQMATLVEDQPASEVLERCRNWATTEEGKSFLADIGWGGEVELWLGSYLMYSGWVAGFDREELLREWGDLKVGRRNAEGGTGVSPVQ